MKFSGIEIKSFSKGGVHPKENKHYTKHLPIENLHIPRTATIPLIQHLGKPAKPIVNKGDSVSEGQLIGEKDGMFSANIHSSIPGKVLKIGDFPCLNNLRVPSVVIQLEGEFNKGQENKSNWKKLKNEKIIEKIMQAGIVGMGGAAFPAHIKLSIPSDKNVDTFIVNGAECEPYLTCDYRLMIEKTDEIIEGTQIIKKILNVKNVFIGIELNKKDVIRKFHEKVSGTDIKVVPLKVRYPQGGEKQLIKAAINKEVPSGGLPFDVGAVVHNVGTILAIRDAVLFDKPLIERVVTVTGSIVKKPGNYKIKIGTQLKEIIEEVGLTEDADKVILGGPMMGITAVSPDVPVTKGTSGILILNAKEEEKIRYDRFESCVHCSRCLVVCPIGLHPAMLSLLAENEQYENMKKYNILDCIECGCCNYVCPADRPIVQFIKIGKLNQKK